MYVRQAKTNYLANMIPERKALALEAVHYTHEVGAYDFGVFEVPPEEEAALNHFFAKSGMGSAYKAAFEQRVLRRDQPKTEVLNSLRSLALVVNLDHVLGNTPMAHYYLRNKLKDVRELEFLADPPDQLEDDFL